MKQYTYQPKDIRILLALESGPEVSAIVAILEQHYTVEQASDTEDAYRRIHSFDPHIAILDYSLSKIHPIELHEGIALVHSHMHAVVCVTAENYEVARRVWNQRGMDFIFKPYRVEQFIASVHKVVRYYIGLHEIKTLRKIIHVREAEKRELEGM